MKKTIGKVLDVYIPKQYKNGLLLDIMDRTNIGFKIKTKYETKEIVLECNDINSQIMKNDLVMIIEQTIGDKDFIDLELFDGEEYGE